MKTDPNVRQLVHRWQARTEEALAHWLPPRQIPPTELHEAMRYATLGGGKRIRPVLVYATGHALGVDPQCLDGPACAVELIHAYSLIHDDLPAMDDDDMRRGKPTCHRAFDEATAILAGDALQSLASYVLAHDRRIDTPPEQRLKMIETLALASGSRGMVGGQAMDLKATGRALNLAELENMHIHKTGALIRASVALGTLCRPGVEEATAHGLDHYAKCIGLAFQIQDDVLDVEGDAALLGKTTGKDSLNDKPTYPALLGLPEARNKARKLVEEALRTLDPLGAPADPLRWVAEYVINRSH